MMLMNDNPLNQVQQIKSTKILKPEKRIQIFPDNQGKYEIKNAQEEH